MRTRTIKLLAFAMVMLTGSLQAQNLKYGVQASSILSVQSSIGDIYDNNDVHTGFGISAFGNYALSNKLKLQAEFSFDQKGSKTDDVENNYEYLSIPVLASYNLGKGTKMPWLLDFYMGPYASFLLNAEQIFSNNELKDIDLVDDTNSSELGLMGGFVYRYGIKNANLLVNLRYGMGLTAFDKNNSDPKNKFLGIGIGYEF